MGAFVTQPRKIAALVKSWLGPERQDFDAMAARSKALGRPEVPARLPSLSAASLSGTFTVVTACECMA